MRRRHHPIKLTILASSGGYAFDYLFSAIEMGIVNAEIAAVVTDRACRTETVAERHGLTVTRIQQSLETSRYEYSRMLLEKIPRETELVLISLRRLISDPLLGAFPNRILNTHPSLLPAYPGYGAIRNLLLEGRSLYGGASCHLVNEFADDGPMVIQSAIPLESHETENAWAMKVWQNQKHNICQAVQFFSDNRVRFEGNRVLVEGAVYGEGLTNPSIEIDFSPLDAAFVQE